MRDRKNERPIDRTRDSSDSMKLPEDAGEIDGMLEINGALHMLARKTIIRMQLADEIDPERIDSMPAPGGPTAFGVSSRVQGHLMIASIQFFRTPPSATPPIYDVVVGSIA